MKVKTIGKKAFLVSILLVFAATTMIFHSCKKEERMLDTLQEQIVANGYDGSFDRAGRIEKTALRVFGVKDRLMYNRDNCYAVFIEFDENRDFEEISNQVMPIILENVDKDELKTVEENTLFNKNLVMIYYGDSFDNDFLEIFKNI